jgi:phosphonoacetaldehyde hydrolase
MNRHRASTKIVGQMPASTGEHRMQQQLEAVIFDWAGTTVDFGSFAPTQIFVDAFREACDFELSLAEARGPMGLGKWQHIEALGRDPLIDARWRAQFGKPMRVEDIDKLYQTFLPLQVERVGLHADLIPGTLATVAELRQRGLKIGSTTGYPRIVMETLMHRAAENGYRPDCTICADDLAAGARPGPWMALQCVLDLKIGNVAHCIKVDDTLPGIDEGRNAGMWAVGLALSGSPAGLTQEQFTAASPEQLADIRARTTPPFLVAGAHYVIDSIAQLLPVVDDIARRLSIGERP